MTDCEHLKGCMFFNDMMPVDSGMGAIYKQNYCLGDNSNCARYKVAKKLGSDKVPVDLYPNMIDEANQIISEG